MWKTAKPFINGGLSGMAATCIIQPIDMVKVRIQIGAQGTPVSLAWCLGNQAQPADQATMHHSGTCQPSALPLPASPHWRRLTTCAELACHRSPPCGLVSPTCAQ